MKIISSDKLITASELLFSHCSLVNDKLLTDSSGILYASTSLQGDEGFELLEKGVQALLSSVDLTPSPITLWSVRYRQQPSSESGSLSNMNDHIVRFPPLSMDLAFDDSILDQVKEVWQKIVGEGAEGEFLVFQDREPYDDDE